MIQMKFPCNIIIWKQSLFIHSFIQSLHIHTKHSKIKIALYFFCWTNKNCKEIFFSQQLFLNRDNNLKQTDRMKSLGVRHFLVISCIFVLPSYSFNTALPYKPILRRDAPFLKFSRNDGFKRKSDQTWNFKELI